MEKSPVSLTAAMQVVGGAMVRLVIVFVYR